MEARLYHAPLARCHVSCPCSLPGPPTLTQAYCPPLHKPITPPLSLPPPLGVSGLHMLLEPLTCPPPPPLGVRACTCCWNPSPAPLLPPVPAHAAGTHHLPPSSPLRCEGLHMLLEPLPALLEHLACQLGPVGGGLGGSQGGEAAEQHLARQLYPLQSLLEACLLMAKRPGRGKAGGVSSGCDKVHGEHGCRVRRAVGVGGGTAAGEQGCVWEGRCGCVGGAVPGGPGWGHRCCVAVLPFLLRLPWPGLASAPSPLPPHLSPPLTPHALTPFSLHTLLLCSLSDSCLHWLSYMCSTVLCCTMLLGGGSQPPKPALDCYGATVCWSLCCAVPQVCSWAAAMRC